MKIDFIFIILIFSLFIIGATTAKAAETDQQTVAQLLANKSDDIQNCVFEIAPDTREMRILANVAIDNSGQAVDVQVTISAGNNSSAQVKKIKTCVESLIYGIKFPAVSVPLTHIERSWRFFIED